jgi:uncharacterized protein (DUF2252 family)
MPMCAQLSVAERRARGTEAATAVPHQAHRGWEAAAGRRSPVAVLAEQEADRLSDLVPVRHGRMMISPFTFYRGAAAVMAEDLRSTPVAGLTAQLCGDAHLSNFGVFGSPERRLVFDVNDFDETLPGPFEYDVERMVTSFVVAARDNGFSAADAKAAARASLAAYRTAMAHFAELGNMDLWYASLDEDAIRTAVREELGDIGKADKPARPGKDKHREREQAKMARKAAKRANEAAQKARTRDSTQALAKLGEMVGGRYRIASQPPVLIPLRELAFEMAPEMTPAQIEEGIRDQFRAYRASLQPDMRHLLERFEIVDAARKVVGVGSVGTRAYIVLLQGRDARDPLFLQIKEATTSVLEGHLPRSRYRQHGQRVVQGQRLMQASSDIYLGWTRGPRGRDFYWRQLRDMKGSAEVEAMTPLGLSAYARACGWTLARAHARSGDPVATAAYLGDGDGFDRAITDFAVRYADQNERDYREFVAAIKSGRLTAVEGV